MASFSRLLCVGDTTMGSAPVCKPLGPGDKFREASEGVRGLA